MKRPNGDYYIHYFILQVADTFSDFLKICKSGIYLKYYLNLNKRVNCYFLSALKNIMLLLLLI